MTTALLPLLLFLLLSAAMVDGLTWNETSIPGCPSYNCGNGVWIEYPFWIPDQTGKTSSFCGYPNFNVSCNGSTPIFRTKSDNYIVREIDTASRIVSLVDSDVVNVSCPRARHNVSLESTTSLLKLKPSNLTYLVFFFQCDGYEGESIPEKYNIDCLDKKWGRSFVFSEKDVEKPTKDYPGLFAACKGGIVVSPVMTGEGENDLARSFGAMMNGGFKLMWIVPPAPCSGCEERGGKCGYDNNGGDGFRCFGVEEEGRKSHLGLKIGLSIGGVLIGLLLACVVLIVYKRQRSKKKGSGYFLTTLFRSGSSNPPSSKDLESPNEGYYKTPIFSYEELEVATDSFHESNELGDGGFGVVFKGKLRDGRIVAVKRLYERNYRRVKQFRNEVEILNRLRHRNLVMLYGCTSAQDTHDLLLVYEFISNGTIADHLHGGRAAENALTWPIRMSIAVETADALAYLHAHVPQIIHRDVKSSNVLLDHNFTVKVADFGLSRLFPPDATHVSTAPQGTPGYVDPEYYQCYQLTDKSDVFSFGVVLVELISSKPAVDITRNRSEINLSNMAIDRILKGLVSELVDPNLGFEKDADLQRMVHQVADLAFRCLQMERDLRPTMEEVRETLKDIAAGSAGSSSTPSACLKHSTEDDASLLHSSSSPFSSNGCWRSVSTTPHASA